jgi:hypothetical protein
MHTDILAGVASNEAPKRSPGEVFHERASQGERHVG